MHGTSGCRNNYRNYGTERKFGRDHGIEKPSSGPSKKNERRLGRDDEADVDYFTQLM